MAIIEDDISDQLKTQALDLIRAKSASLQVERCEFRIGKDHDGEDSVFIDVWHPLSPVPVKPRLLIDVHSAVRDLFFKHREGRFPFLNQHFDDAQTFGKAA
jgi:hypothetical protein